jgi:hypothetical protein
MELDQEKEVKEKIWNYQLEIDNNNDNLHFFRFSANFEINEEVIFQVGMNSLDK